MGKKYSLIAAKRKDRNNRRESGNNKRYNKGNISFEIKASKKSTVLVNTVYFPGWEVKIDGLKPRLIMNSLV